MAERTIAVLRCEMALVVQTATQVIDPLVALALEQGGNRS